MALAVDAPTQHAFDGLIRFRDQSERQFRREMERFAKRFRASVDAYVRQFSTADGRFVGDARNLRRLNQARREIDNILRTSGYERLVSRYLKRYPRVKALVRGGWGKLGVKTSLGTDNERALRLLAGSHLQAFADIGRTATDALKNDLMRSVVGNAKPNDLLTRFGAAVAGSGKTDKAGAGMFRHVNTLASTAIAELDRTMMEKLGEQAGVERWVYFGPVRSTTRDFCRRLKGQANNGKTWTRDQIDGLDNGQTSNVFVTAGGFNCNHEWLPVIEE